jgi:hypothetical protein
MRLKWQDLVNVLAVAIAALMYIFIIAWIHSRELDLSGTHQVSGTFRIWVVPLLEACLVAAAVGAGLASFLKTDRPVGYALLFGGALVFWWWWSTTIFNPAWQDALWLALDALLPAAVAATVTLRLYRRRQGRMLSQA